MKMAFTAGVTALGSKATWAQTNYPDRAVTFIVPQGPGTEVDWLARLYANKLSEFWRVPVVVENKVGAGGDIGTGYAANAKGDGYTLLFTGGTFVINPLLKKSSYDPIKSFKPVMLTGASYMALAVSTKHGATTFEEFIASVKKKPGTFNYGTPGIGSFQHLLMEVLKKEASLDIAHVPYIVGGKVVTDLAGGTIDAAIVSPPHVVDLEKSGKVKILAVLGSERDVRISATPTIVELGFRGAAVTAWAALLAPIGTPDVLVQKINQDMGKVRELPDFKETMLRRRGGAEDPGGGPPERLAQIISSDLRRWRDVIAAARISAN